LWWQCDDDYDDNHGDDNDDGDWNIQHIHDPSLIYPAVTYVLVPSLNNLKINLIRI
jgi:hypothetical protein